MEQVSFLPLGGVVDITKNLYVYEYKNQILIVDCGIGFANDNMLGVDLLVPDITYLLKPEKRIVGMMLTHGHEDHIGALPYLLPSLPSFEIYGSTFTAALANEKLKEFKVPRKINTLPFGQSINLGPFNATLIRVTHSVPDTAHIFIKTPIGNFYHGSDFKLDPSPYDQKPTDYNLIKSLSSQGVICLMSDVLGAEKAGRVPPEIDLTSRIEYEMERAPGKFIFTTYSSNISRLNQVIEVSKKLNRQVGFIGRSLIKAKEVAQNLGYLKLDRQQEVMMDQIKRINDKNLTLIVAGAQGQEGSALSRIANGDVREVKLRPSDTIVFSSDPIPGNEISVYSLIDSIAKIGCRVIYSSITRDFHVSGHGLSEELMEMVDMVRPKNVMPIGATYRHMAAYKRLVKEKGYKDSNVLLLDDGQEVIFTPQGHFPGNQYETRNVYVDQISGEEVEKFVLRDREKLSKDGIVILMIEIDSNNGQIIGDPNVITRGILTTETDKLSRGLIGELRKNLRNKKVRVSDWSYMRKTIGEISERYILNKHKRRPLVLPIVIEV